MLAQLAASTTGEVQKAHLLRRAQLLEREKELPAAVEGYARLLAVAPTDPNAVAGLERLMELPDVRPDAARLLEPVYRSLNDVRHLVEVLEIRLAGASPQDRLPLLGEISNLRETLGQKDLAFAARVRAFGEMPESPEAREELERLAAETGAFEELAAAYQDQLERGVTNATSTELWRRLAVLWSERLDRLDLAIRAYEELGRREPRNMAVLEALARIHTKAGDARELASVMKRMVMVEPSPPKQIDLLFRLGTLAEETLSDKQLAAQCYGEILARKPDDEDAIKFLGKVLTESERWPELASLIVREIQLADSTGRHEEMFDLMVRLGRLRLARLRDPRGALDIFEDVLRRKQGHAGAIGALEEMARSDSPLRGEAAEALEPIFTSGGDHLRLVQMLESRASTEPVAAERAALLRKVAKLYAGPMQNAELAFVSASRALRELPDEEASLTLAVTLSERASSGGEELAGAPGGDPSPGLGGRRPGGDPPRAGPGPGGARAQGGGHRRLEAGARGRPLRRRVDGLPGPPLPGGGAGPRAAGDLPAAALDQRGAGRPRRAALPDRRAPGRRPPRHRGRHGHAPAAPRAQAGRRPGPREARPALPEAGALARAGRRHRPAAGAAGRRPGLRSADAPGGGARDAAPRQVRRPRAVRPGPRRPAEAPGGPRAARGLGPARAAEQADDGRTARRRTAPRARRRSSLRCSRSAWARRRIRSSASSSWSSWRASARRRAIRRASSTRWPAPSARTPTTPRSGPASARRPRVRGPTRSWGSSTRRSSPASPRRRTPPRSCWNWGR